MGKQRLLERNRSMRLKMQLQKTVKAAESDFESNPNVDAKRRLQNNLRRTVTQFEREEAREQFYKGGFRDNPMMNNNYDNGCLDCSKPTVGFRLGFNMGFGNNGVNFNLTASAGAQYRTQNFQGVAFASASLYGGQQLGTSFMTKGLQFDLTAGAYASIGNGSGSAHNFYTLNSNTASPFNNTFDTSFTYGQARTLNSAINAGGDGPGWQTQGLVGLRLGENFSFSSNNDAKSYGTGLLFNDKGSDAGWTGGVVLNVGGIEAGYQNFSGYWSEFGSKGKRFGHKFSAQNRVLGNGAYHESLNRAFNFVRKGNTSVGIYSDAWFQNWIHEHISDDGTYNYNNQGKVDVSIGKR